MVDFYMTTGKRKPNMNETFIANLKKAIRDKDIVTIGGGDFSTVELMRVLIALEAFNKIAESAGYGNDKS